MRRKKGMTKAATCEAIVATGQSHSQLKRATGWSSVGGLLIDSRERKH